MDIRKKYQEEITHITNYYDNKLEDDSNLVLVGLNNDRGFGIRKNILKYLKEALQSGKYDMTVFDAYSMFFNKTRHIDYYLKNNISLYEIELMKKYGTANEVSHAMGDNKVIFNIVKDISFCLCNPSSSDKSICLSDTIREATEPIIVYSSGINDIMYQTCIDPFSIKGYYDKDREKYEYAVSQVSGSKRKENLEKIIHGHEENFEKILGINNGSKICSLGAYLYSDSKDYDRIFQEFVLSYNEELEKLCKQYGVHYVNTRFLEDTKFRNISFTYLSPVSSILAGAILKELSDNLETPNIEVPKFEYTNKGSVGVLSDMVSYRDNLFMSDGYFYSGKQRELSREEDVFSAVILERSRKK